MALSKRHYEQIAATFKARADAEDDSARGAMRWLARDLAQLFKKDNERFDESRFLKACGF